MPPLTEILVIRHVETQSNVEGKLQGHLDSALTDVGKLQAKALAARMPAFEIDALYSSDLGRALATAEEISRTTGKTVIQNPRLRERAYGVLEGLRWDEARLKFPEIHDGYRNDPEYVIPNGESLRQLFHRVAAVMTDLAAEHEGRRIAVVSHGGFIACLFRFVVELSLSHPRKARLPNAAINAIDYQDGNWMVRSWGDTAHLGPDLMTS